MIGIITNCLVSIKWLHIVPYTYFPVLDPTQYCSLYGIIITDWEMVLKYALNITIVFR